MLIILFSIFATQTIFSQKMNILVFSKTAGYRHDCIEDATTVLKELANKQNWHIDATEDSLVFTPNNLKKYDVVIFLQTTNDILNNEQQEAFENHIENGGSLVTIHSGTVTEYDWPWYEKAIGAYFTGHPPVQSGKVIIEDRNHPSTKHFSDSVWVIEDEWYSFDRNPRDDVHVLMSIDENSYEFKNAEQRMGDHPLVWYKKVGKGRVFQTALGHESELYQNELFQKHLIGAIEWAGEK
ncbi:MAG: ThuA domain-containing protein [Prolixibacteraceae bacterium]|nr:ThuA domain-containing protein [Prolixibacteraceae bacterium]